MTLKNKLTIEEEKQMAVITPFTPVPTEGMETSKTKDYVKPTRIYEDANDQHIRNIVVFSDGTNAFVDEAKTVKVPGETLLRWATLGLLVKTSTGYAAVTEVSEAGGVVTVKAGDLELKSAEA